MRRALIALTVVGALAGCSNDDDGWRPYAKFHRGDLVIFRLDGHTGMVMNVKCSDGACTYRVQHPRWVGGYRETNDFEIAKAPQVVCNDRDRQGGTIVFQQGDRAAEVLCTGTWRGPTP